MKSTRLLLVALTSMFVAAGLSAADDPRSLVLLYEKVSTALAADDLVAARAAADALAVDATGLKQNTIAATASAVAKAPDLAATREAFKALSRTIIVLAREQKGNFIMTCPMANADWVQGTREVANPYLGKDMSACGEVKEETKG